MREARWWRVAVLLLLLPGGCASYVGYPDDPAQRGSLARYYGPGSETAYKDSDDETTRTNARNAIVRTRLHGYDLEYSAFKRELAAQANTVNVGGSLAVLAVGGLAATTGHAATAGSLAAAGAGVVGAQGLINKELFFQKTLPALMAQMDAARDRVILAILNGLDLPDSRYSLTRANADLARLKDAGSIEAAIASIGEQASAARTAAADAITVQRDATFVMTRVPRQSVMQRIAKLSDAQVVKLANALLPRFAGAPDTAKADARPFLPNRGDRFEAAQGARARQFLTFWADGEVMSPDRLAVWTTALDAL